MAEYSSSDALERLGESGYLYLHKGGRRLVTAIIAESEDLEETRPGLTERVSKLKIQLASETYSPTIGDQFSRAGDSELRWSWNGVKKQLHGLEEFEFVRVLTHQFGGDMTERW